MNCGIYKITNTNGKIYIGSSIHLEVRWNEHLKTLRNSSYEHTNSHLQRAWNKYGEESFVFVVLLYCDQENLIFYEQRAIDEYKSLDGKSGYNIRPATRRDLTGSNYDEWIKKCSEVKKGKHPSKETIKKMSEVQKGKNSHWYGKYHSKETKIKISDNHVDVSGKNNPNYGNFHSKETIKKMSVAKKGKNHPMYGKKRPEHSKRMSSKNNPNAKAVIVNGKYYNTITEAAQDLQVSNTTIYRRIKTNKPGYFFK